MLLEITRACLWIGFIIAFIITTIFCLRSSAKLEDMVLVIITFMLEWFSVFILCFTVFNVIALMIGAYN